MEDQLDTVLSNTWQPDSGEILPSPLSPVSFPEHGGDLRGLEVHLPAEQKPILDFSVCLNPLGPPESLASVIRGNISKTQAYPSPNAAPLKERLAAHHHLASEHFAVTHGSTQLIYTLPDLWPQSKSVCIIAPCFAEYEKAFESRGITTHFFLSDPETGFELQWESLHRFLASIKNLGGIVLGHPTTPAGTLCGIDFLDKLLAFSNDNKQMVIIDETFVDFTDRGKFLQKLLPECPGLILVRSFSKLFSIPGIRLGYGIMSPTLAKKMQQVIPPWSVGSLEIETGKHFLEESDYIKNTHLFLNGEKNFLLRELKSIDSLKTFQSEACFLLFQLNENGISPELLFTQLLKNGFLVRNCGNFRGLNDHFFRIGIRSRQENSALMNCLKNILDGHRDDS